MLIEIFQINDLGELGILKQRPSYVAARSPGLPELLSPEDPSLSSCCGEISRPLSRLPSSVNTRAALSASTVLGVAMAAGNAIVLPPIFKAGDSSRHSSGGSRSASIPGQGGSHGFRSKNPWRPWLWGNGDRSSCTGLCLCVGVRRGGGRFHLCIFPSGFPFALAHSLNNNAPSAALSWAQCRRLRGWLWLAPSRGRLWSGSLHGGPCPPHSSLCHTPIGRDSTLAVSQRGEQGDWPHQGHWLVMAELGEHRVSCPPPSISVSVTPLL